MRKWLIIVLSFLLSSCKGQQKNETTTTGSNQKTKKQIEMTTEKFDIKTFEKNKIGSEYNFVMEDSTKVRQLSNEDNYSEYITPPPPNYFETYNEYFKTGGLKSQLISFPNNFLKHYWEYNSKGKLIEEIDYDIPYKFTFNNLVNLIQKEKDTINLYDKDTSIGRGSDEKGTDWYITYKKVPMRREVIKVDGITGEILERSFHPHEDN